MSDKCHVKGQFLDVWITVGELLVISLKLMTKRVEDELRVHGLFTIQPHFKLIATYNTCVSSTLPNQGKSGRNLENCVILKSHRNGLIIVHGGMCDFFQLYCICFLKRLFRRNLFLTGTLWPERNNLNAIHMLEKNLECNKIFMLFS